MSYKFLNMNPLGKREEDCVCRAISLGVDDTYERVNYKLNLIGDLFDCEKLCECCYKHLLDYVYELDRYECFHGMLIKDFLNIYNKGTYIIRIDGHLTCAIDGVIYDTWDCTDCYIDIVWTKSG